MGNHNQWKKGGGSTVTGGITKTYTNNNLNQVTNLSTATNTAGTVTTDTLAMSYDLQGGLNVSYPSNGTTYSILIYDDANRLKQVIYRLKSTDALSKQILYSYDGANRKRRTIEEDWNGTAWTPVSDKRYVYDGMNVLQERNGTGTTVVAKHVWGLSVGGGIGGLLSRTEVSTSANYFYHYDGSGNVMQLTDSTQAVATRYDYDPWGVVQTNSGPYSSQTYRWITKEQA